MSEVLLERAGPASFAGDDAGGFTRDDRRATQGLRHPRRSTEGREIIAVVDDAEVIEASHARRAPGERSLRVRSTVEPAPLGDAQRNSRPGMPGPSAAGEYGSA
jgi:hypothetical protein